MNPYYNTIAAIYAAQYESLAAIDTEGLYTCLDVGCCGNDTQMFTNLFLVNFLLDQYQLTGTLPVIANPCCTLVCGDLTGGTPDIITSPTFTDLTVTDDLVVGDAATVTGLLTAGSATVTGLLTAGDVTATDDLIVGDDAAITGDLTLTGLFSSGGVSQPPYRTGTGTLAGGTLAIAAAWVTANTILNATYTQASAAGEANISIGTITPGVSFVINGEGTNTFNWHAVVVP